jgi:uncharacterized membrane protein
VSDLLGNKQFAYAVLIVGAILVLLSILVDPLRGYDVCMGTEQIIMLIVGMVIALSGVYLAFLRHPDAPMET